MKMVSTVERIPDAIHGSKPVLAMVLVQMMYAAVNVVYKLAVNDGMKLPILVAYRFIFAAIFIVPVAFLVERNTRPTLTGIIMLQAFCCGLFGGALVQNLYVKALLLTSATFVSAMTNLTPVITYIITVCFRLENLSWKTSYGLAKIAGTALGVAGAMLLTFYRGTDLHIWKTSVDLLHSRHQEAGGQLSNNNNITIGSLIGIGSVISYSIWLTIQANMVKTYPCPYSITALTSLFAAVQSLVYGLCTERHWDDWKLGWNVRLLTVAYSGVFGSGLLFTLVGWCVRKRGPLFVSAFIPLMLVFVAITGSLVLDECLSLGMVLGAILIILGLYVLLWGKRKEAKKKNVITDLEAMTEHTRD